MDMMSDFDILDIMIGSDNINQIERDLASGFGESSVQMTLSLTYQQGKTFPRKRA